MANEKICGGKKKDLNSELLSSINDISYFKLPNPHTVRTARGSAAG